MINSISNNIFPLCIPLPAPLKVAKDMLKYEEQEDEKEKNDAKSSLKISFDTKDILNWNVKDDHIDIFVNGKVDIVV